MSRSRSRFVPALIVLGTLPIIILTGCGAATSFSNPTTSARVAGRVFGGQQPVSGAAVTVWAAGTTGYGSANPLGALATTTTLDDGTFSFPAASYTCTAGEQVYITAAGGISVAGSPANANIMLATGLGDCTAAQSATVEINEVTTAATAFALAQFFTTSLGTLSTDSFGTDPADLTAFTNSNQFTIPTLIDIPNGLVQPNTPALTIEAAKIYSIANILAACVNDATPGYTTCGTLYEDTTPPTPGGLTPSDTLQAAVQMALFPYQNVDALFKLASKTSPFAGLPIKPNDWTVGVSYTSSAYSLSILGGNFSSTSASIDIDVSGKVWFASNLSGSAGFANFDPTSASFNGPYATSYFTDPQYVAIDSAGVIYGTDLGSHNLVIANTLTPATTGQYYKLTTILNGQALAADAVGDVYFAYTDESNHPAVGVESAGAAYAADDLFTYNPTGLIASDSFLYASTSGIKGPCALEQFDGGLSSNVLADTGASGTCTSGGVAYASGGKDVLDMASSLNQFCIMSFTACGDPLSAYVDQVNFPQGIATDGKGNEWIANSGNASVFTFGPYTGDTSSYSPVSPVDYIHDTDNGSTMITPYAIAIDGSGNVWIANAGCVSTGGAPCNAGSFVLSELIGAAGPTITPLSAQMLNDGSLVGTPPTTIPSDASGHPHSFASTQSSSLATRIKRNAIPVALGR